MVNSLLHNQKNKEHCSYLCLIEYRTANLHCDQVFDPKNHLSIIIVIDEHEKILNS